MTGTQRMTQYVHKKQTLWRVFA